MRSLEKPMGLEQWRQFNRIALERGYRPNVEGGLFALIHCERPVPPFALFELNNDGIEAAVQWLQGKRPP
jgi:hypothetical protein